MPGAPATNERTRARPSRSLELERHPGARLFIGSGTIDHESRALRQPLFGSVAYGIIGP